MMLPAPIADWFAARGWRLREHQLAMLAADRAGEHALLVAATGAGKTLAGFLPTLVEAIDRADGAGTVTGEGISTLYISPLKALASDVRRNLLRPIEEIGLPLRVETRTGDTSADARARQRSHPPDILLTTPESLSLLLSQEDAPHIFRRLDRVVIDEVHAFGTGKRGDLLQLSLARLQALRPGLRRAGLSATVAEPDRWRAWLAPGADAARVRLVEGEPGAPADIRILLPQGRVPWSGHSGRYAAHGVMAEIARHKTTIVFTNTRGLAELIFQEL